MADEFDVVDFVHDAVLAANTGLLIYKDRSEDGETENHIVVNSMPFNENDDFINQGYVNVNIFVKQHENGMIDRGVVKTAVRAIKAKLKLIATTAGNYRHAEILWSESLGELKQGFDCRNIRLLVKTDK